MLKSMKVTLVRAILASVILFSVVLYAVGEYDERSARKACEGTFEIGLDGQFICSAADPK